MGTIHQRLIGSHVMLLVLDNPPVNALGFEMREQLRDILSTVEKDTSVRALVLTGKGKAFCGGDDLKEQQATNNSPSAARAEQLDEFEELFNRVEALRVPVICAINGWCLGGGLEVALCCDIRIASTEARFTCAEVNVGLVASAYRLPRLIGMAHARHMLLTGTRYDAATAEKFGLVTAVYKPDHLEQEALALGEVIASRAPLAIEATKQIARQAFDLEASEAASLIKAQVLTLAQSDDHKNALVAFREKREPCFFRR